MAAITKHFETSIRNEVVNFQLLTLHFEHIRLRSVHALDLLFLIRYSL